VPNQLTEYVHEQQNDLWMRNDALFVQEQWTRGRLTVQGGLRFDRAWSRTRATVGVDIYSVLNAATALARDPIVRTFS
jgi:outer membrane receptor protein involved in Fe transport